MSTLKLALGLAALVLLSVISLSGCSIQSDARSVNAAAAKIADFTLPPGYASEATAEIGGYLFVSYAPGDGHSHIQFVQAPADAPVDQATLEGYLQQAADSRGYASTTHSQVVGSRQATIRGQIVTLVVGEATNHDGQPFRTLTGVFSAKGGTALVSVESPISSWNQEAVDQFIASIR